MSFSKQQYNVAHYLNVSIMFVKNSVYWSVK